jgi:iron-sulfur cluster repair protein YtfE (RIC family)
MSRSTKPFIEEHGQLRGQLERLREVAGRVRTEQPEADLGRELQSIKRFLDHDLLPHAMGEETSLYPALGRVLCGSKATSTMRRDHLEIRRLIGELDALLPRPVAMTPASWETSLREVLYSLYAVIRLHFAKEEEIFLPVVEDALDAREARSVFEAAEERRAEGAAGWHPDESASGSVPIERSEVEGARLLANEASGRLLEAGLSEQDIVRLAEEFVAREREGDPREFAAWARRQVASRAPSIPPIPPVTGDREGSPIHPRGRSSFRRR